MDKTKSGNAVDYMIAHGIVRNVSVSKNYGIYVFENGQAESESLEPAIQRSDAETIPVSVISRLEQMASTGETEDERRIGAILIKRISQGVFTLGPEDVERAYGLGDSACTKLLMTAINLGVLCKGAQRDREGRIIYAVSRQPPQRIRIDGLTMNQRQILTTLYAAFKSQRFSTSEGAKACRAQFSGFTYHIKNFSQRGILDSERSSRGPAYYTFAVTPEKYPQCFLSEPRKEKNTTSAGATMSTLPMSAAAV